MLKYIYKKLNTVVIFTLSAMLIAGCANKAQTSAEASEEGLSIVAAIFPLYDFTREIAGEEADIQMLVPPAAEIHHFEPSPQDIVKIQDCDVFIYIGGESDDWVKTVLASVDTDNIRVISFMDEGAAIDEHIWTSPRNAVGMVEKITENLCEADPGNEAYFKENADAYITRLSELDKQFETAVDEGRLNIIAFGDRFPFTHLANEYGLSYLTAFAACADETEPSLADVKSVIDEMNAHNIPIVFHTETSDGKMAEAISEATGASVRLFHAVHSISKEELENGEGYISIMTRNASALQEALR